MIMRIGKADRDALVKYFINYLRNDTANSKVQTQHDQILLHFYQDTLPFNSFVLCDVASVLNKDCTHTPRAERERLLKRFVIACMETDAQLHAGVY